MLCAFWGLWLGSRLDLDVQTSCLGSNLIKNDLLSQVTVGLVNTSHVRYDNLTKYRKPGDE